MKSAAYVRPAQSGDREAIAQLHAQNWRLAYRGILSDRYIDLDLDQDRQADWLQRFASPVAGQTIVVAEGGDGQLLGFACAYGHHDPDAGTLVENLHAHPAHRGLGVGRTLLAHLAQWSLARNPDDALHLWVLAANAPAIGFYQRMGAVNDQSSVWDAPGGTHVPELRFIWRDPRRLLIA